MKKVALVMLSLKFTKSNPSSNKCNKRPCTSPAHQRRPTSMSKLGPWYFHERDLKWRWSYSYLNSVDEGLEKLKWDVEGILAESALRWAKTKHHILSLVILWIIKNLKCRFWKILEVKFVDTYISGFVFLFKKLASLISHNDLFNFPLHCPLASCKKVETCNNQFLKN